LTCNPARITVQEERTGQGRPTKFYELNTANKANKANKANNKQPRGFAGGFDDREQSEPSELTPPDSSQVRTVRELENSAATRMDAGSSPSSLTSQPKTETVEVDL
jgi:hypothetical protein